MSPAAHRFAEAGEPFPRQRLARFQAIVEKPRRRALGLMSGTSVDAIDVAMVGIEGSAERARVELEAFRSFPFPRDLRRRIFRLFDPATARIDEVCHLDFLLGELFAAAALRLLVEVGRQPAEVDLVGAAGQTVWHDPAPVEAEVDVDWLHRPLTTRSTLALGQPAVIAERTGIVTVGDLRVRDVAAGGQGAPLMAYADWVLLRHPERGRAVQNVGGIGNVTYLPPAAERRHVLAFDTGPGNMVIDALAERLSDGRLHYDEDGAIAAAGRVDEALLGELLGDEYFRRPPPKTTGRERFGRQYAERLAARAAGLDAADLMATATALTAESIARAYRDFLMPRGPLDEVVLYGGGARNPTLVGMLRQRLGGIPVTTDDETGGDVKAREAVGIAVIAHDALLGHDTNLTGATGGLPTVLGKILL